MLHDSSKCPTCEGKLSSSMSDAEFGDFLHQCRVEMATKQDRFNGENPIGTAYHYDIDAGTFHLGTRELSATVIGSFCPSRGTWLWGWANDSFSAASRAKAARFSEQLHEITGFEVFRDEGAHASSQDAEDFTAMVLHVAGGIAFWRNREEDCDLYLCLEDPRPTQA